MNDKNIRNIICGGDNGDILGFGCNWMGQLGLGSANASINPALLMNDKNIRNIICGTYHTIIYK